MKQLGFMLVLAALGTVGTLFNPFYGVFVYYLLAVLRPQYIWRWALPEDFPWSFLVAMATIAVSVLGLLGIVRVNNAGPEEASGQHRPMFGHICFALFACWVCVTYFTAKNQAAAYFTLVEYLKIFIIYFAAAYLIRTVNQVWALFLMIGFVLGYISYEINFQYFVQGYLGIQRNGYGGLDNNGAGLMLAMGVPICWFAFEGTNSWWRWICLLLIPAIVHAVLMTYSRGAMLSLIVSLPILFFRSRMKLWFLIGLGLFACLLLPALAGKEIQGRFFSIQGHEGDASANSRKDSWNAAFRIAQDHPLFGVGIRNSNLFSQQYGADMEGRTIHSQYLQILADNGYPGLGLYLAVIGSSLYGLWRARLSAEGEGDEANRVLAISSGLEASLILFCFGALFLSLEVVELPFLVLLLGAQLSLVSERATPELNTELVSNDDEAHFPDDAAG
jgi:probable O-glycosylation ligase (exosortase A-associated)